MPGVSRSYMHRGAQEAFLPLPTGQISPTAVLFVSAVAAAGYCSLQMLRSIFSSLFTDAMVTTSAKKTGVSFCFVTTPSSEAADALSSKIINEKLAACVNIIPGVQSRYLWEGKVVTDQELILMIKTRSSLTAQLSDFVVKHHPYDVPEVRFQDMKRNIQDIVDACEREPRQIAQVRADRKHSRGHECKCSWSCNTPGSGDMIFPSRALPLFFFECNAPFLSCKVNSPQVICTEVTDGLPAYLKWVAESTKNP